MSKKIDLQLAEVLVEKKLINREDIGKFFTGSRNAQP